MLASILVALALAELGCRVLAPSPYIELFEINSTAHGNLTRYDEELGWSGVPKGSVRLVTRNARVSLRHNAHGDRDIDHEPDDRPAIVLLGDSHTWGYEVEFHEMFANLLRDRLPDHSIHNLAHRGWGTDQSLLALRRWRHETELALCLLFFSDNDVPDNNSALRNNKAKPWFEVEEGRLVLHGVPPPRVDDWSRPPVIGRAPQRGPIDKAKVLLLRSHLVHRLWVRGHPPPELSSLEAIGDTHDLSRTEGILAELSEEVRIRGGELRVCFIPSRGQRQGTETAEPYQNRVGGLCVKLGIAHLDLGPALEPSWLPVFQHYGNHLNPRGHRIVADAVQGFLDRSSP